MTESKPLDGFIPEFDHIFLSEKVVWDCIMALSKNKSHSEGCLRHLLPESPSEHIEFSPDKFKACCKRLSQDINIDPTFVFPKEDSANGPPLLTEEELIELFNHLTTKKSYENHPYPTAKERRDWYIKGECNRRKRSAINYEAYAKQQHTLHYPVTAFKDPAKTRCSPDFTNENVPTDMTRIRRFSITKKGLRRHATIYASRSYPSSLNSGTEVDSPNLTQAQHIIPVVQSRAVSSVDVRVNGVSILESQPARLTRSTCDLYETRKGKPITFPELYSTVPISHHRISIQGEPVVGKSTLIQIFVEGHGHYMEESLGKYILLNIILNVSNNNNCKLSNFTIVT